MIPEDDKQKPVGTTAATEAKYSRGNAENLDAENRDPNHLNSHIAVSTNVIIGCNFIFA